ncbi:MAG: ABC transporter ATP-binding protein [Chloroflexota bacterium]|nr:ABC transporter ATP-binding protein [Chloroflexota bacterium]
MAAIVVKDVVKRYAGVERPAVDHVSFEAEEGEIVVLLGPSGCGKTTLLKMVNRLYEPTSGEIYVEGTEIHEIPATELRRRIGYVIQATGLFPHMTIEENIATVPKLLGWKRERYDERIDELLQLLHLPLSYRTRYPAQLSGGEQQRVGIARALAADPRLLLMDEPFGAIDAITRTRLQQELRALQQQLKKTILFVTHDVDEALLLADRILILRTGQIEQYAPPLEIVTNPANEFVAELIGAGDVFRRLSLLRVDQAMEPLPRGAIPSATISCNANLRDALARMLWEGEQQLTVLDERGEEVGLLRYEQVRRCAGAEQVPA